MAPVGTILSAINGRNRYRIAAAVVVGAGITYSLFALGAVQWWHRFWRTAPRPERRRAHRLPFAVAVFVYGHRGDEPFWENTETVNISEIGGLIPLTLRFVVPRQTLAISTLRTDQPMLCRVARVETTIKEIVVGFEFLSNSPEFWQIKFLSTRDT